jgi:hypothetical protein
MFKDSSGDADVRSSTKTFRSSPAPYIAPLLPTTALMAQNRAHPPPTDPTYIEIHISLLPVVTPEAPRLPGGAFSVVEPNIGLWRLALRCL